MTTYPRPLTLTFIQSQPLPPGKYFDQDGFYVRVRRSGTKYWEHRFRVNGTVDGASLRRRDRITRPAARGALPAPRQRRHEAPAAAAREMRYANGRSTVEPVVRRSSMARCTSAASRSG